MSPYGFLISQMTWSYSRLRCFESCPYQFLNMYILASEIKSGFYAQYGTLIHDTISHYFEGGVSKEELIAEYLTRFYMEVQGKIAPEVRQKFFIQGLNALRAIQPCPLEIVGVEMKEHFDVEGYPFVGILDLLLRKPTGELIIVDHKSRDLKPRSRRRKPTKSDKELDEYLVQLYLYAHCIHEKFGQFPEKLVFHCYRTGNVIVEPFRIEAYEQAIRWAVDTIHQIEQAEKFPPCIEWFRCHHLCGVQDSCEYFELGGF